MALNDAFEVVKGTLYKSQPGASLGSVFSTANDANARLKIFVENNYIGALMDGNDDTAIAGIRISTSGRKEGDGISANARFIRALLNQMLVDQIAADLDRLRDIEKEQAQLEAENAAIEEKYLSEEDRQQAPDENDQEYFERKKRLLEAAVANGDMTQAEFDAWLQNNQRLEALAQEKEQILARISEYDAEVLAFKELSRQKEELLEKIASLDNNIEGHENALTRLRTMRAMDAEQVSQALDVLLVDFPDLNVNIPAGTDPHEAVEIVYEAIETETDTMRRDQLDHQQSADALEAAQETVVSVMSDAQKDNSLTSQENEQVLAAMPQSYNPGEENDMPTNNGGLDFSSSF